VVRYDSRSHQFLPYLSSISAGEADFSSDGEWIVYISYPELTLWRARTDGSQKMQLTYRPIFATLPRWSPDGRQIAFGRPSYGMDLGELEIQIFDLSTRQSSAVPGSRGMFSPRWSPDGRYLVALASDSKKPMLFNLSTRQWSEWLRTEDGTIGYPVWARDSKSTYIERFLGAEPSIHTLKLGANGSERFLSWNDLHRFGGVWGSWSGVAPDGSVLTVRDVSSHDIYALDLQLPLRAVGCC
jgi:WD40 repeat protein